MVKRDKNEQPRDYEELPGVSNDTYRKIAGVFLAGLVGGGTTFIAWLGVGVNSLSNTVPVVIAEQENAKEHRDKIELRVDANKESSDINFRRVFEEQARNREDDKNNHPRIK